MRAPALQLFPPGYSHQPNLLAWISELWQSVFGRSDIAPRQTVLHMVQASGVDARGTLTAEDARRFETIIGPHLDSAYNFARFLCGDADIAADIVQEAFLRAFRGFGGYRGGDPRAWMFAIIRNCHRAWRVEGRRRAHYEVSMTTGENDAETEGPAYNIASEMDTPEVATMRNSETARVRMVISGLSEPMREILVLRELEDLTYRQISEILDVPIGTVMSRLARARTDFGQAWQELQNREVRQ